MIVENLEALLSGNIPAKRWRCDECRIVQEFINVETVGGSSQPLLYREDIVEIFREQVVVACKKDVTFRCRHNGRGASFHPVISKWFQYSEVITVQRECFHGNRTFIGFAREATDHGVPWVLFKYIRARLQAR